MSGHSRVAKREYFGAVPKTVRGFGVFMDANATHFAYCSADHIVIRCFERPQQADVFRGHTAPTAVRFCPTGPMMASGDASGMIKVWSLESPSICRLEKQAFPGKVTDIAWSPDGERLLLCGKGKSVHAMCIMVDGGSMVGEFTGFSDEVISGDFRPARPFKMALACNDRQVAFWKGPPLKEEWRKIEQDVLTRQVRFSPDGKFFVFAGMGKLVVYDAESGERALELPAEHKGTVCSVAWSPDSTQIITASCDQTVKLWELASASCLTTFTFSELQEEGSVVFQQLGVIWGSESMVSVGLDGNLNMLDRSQPSHPFVLPGLCGPIEAMVVDYSAAPPIVYAGGTTDGVCKVVGFRPAENVDTLYSSQSGAICTVAGVGPSRAITGACLLGM